VFHLAGQPGVKSFGGVFPVYVRQNVLASQRLFEAAAAAGTRAVLASSSSVYGDAETYPTPEDAAPRPLSPYGITKLACEHLAEAYRKEFGLDVATVRYFTIYGPRQRPDMAFTKMTSCLAEGRAFELFGDGSQSRSFTYVDDAVDATVATMERAPSGAVYNVGGGTEVSMLEAIEVLGAIAGRRLELVRSPRREGDARRTAADTTRIGAELGWQPTTSFEDGLAAQWRWAADRVAAA
jgi:nucleoside-diphosphate-sugar epimerase